MKAFIKLGFVLLFGGVMALASANEKAQPASDSNVAEQTQKVDLKQVKKTALNPNLVNINIASAAELQDKLVGIGEKKAQAIVEYREKNGAFLSLEQLTEVSGIGKATVEKNRDRIVLK